MKPRSLFCRFASATSCGWCLLLTSAAMAWHADTSASRSVREISGIDRGMVWIDGEFVPPPYCITTQGNTVTLNGVSWPASSSGSADFPALLTDHEYETSEFAELHTHACHTAERLAGFLRIDYFVIAFSDLPALSIPRGTAEYQVCSTLCADQPTDTQIAEVLEMTGDASVRRRLKQWIDDPKLSQSLRSELQSRMQVVDTAEHQNRRDIAAVKRMQMLAYPLTVVGMLLGVLGLGHMLKWSGLQAAASSTSPECVQAAEFGLLLMTGMAVVDLIWTILAGQAGSMTEINPLGARLISSPVSLVAFKIVATALGCGILYGWRQRKQIQQATWWMCLVCILLTFRWVVVDSLAV